MTIFSQVVMFKFIDVNHFKILVKRLISNMTFFEPFLKVLKVINNSWYM